MGIFMVLEVFKSLMLFSVLKLEFAIDSVLKLDSDIVSYKDLRTSFVYKSKRLKT